MALKKTARTSSSSATTGGGGTKDDFTEALKATEKLALAAAGAAAGNNTTTTTKTTTKGEGAYGQFAALARLWSMWRAVLWIGSHRQYLSLGVLLAEYMTKTALACLPHDEEEQWEKLLAMLGMNLKSIGIEKLGESALSVMMTSGSFPSSGGAPAPAAHALLSSSSSFHHPHHHHHHQPHVAQDLRNLMAHVRALTLAMPERLPDRMHRAFLQGLRRGEEMHAAARAAYGDAWAQWVHFLPATASLLRLRDLQEAYDGWHEKFALQASQAIEHLGGSAIQTAVVVCPFGIDCAAGGQVCPPGSLSFEGAPRCCPLARQCAPGYVLDNASCLCTPLVCPASSGQRLVMLPNQRLSCESPDTFAMQECAACGAGQALDPSSCACVLVRECRRRIDAYGGSSSSNNEPLLFEFGTRWQTGRGRFECVFFSSSSSSSQQ